MTFAESIFVDTIAWFALADQGDANHGKAAGVYPSLLSTYRRLVTSNLIIAEAHVLILMELGSAAAMDFLDRVKTSPRIALIYSTEDVE